MGKNLLVVDVAGSHICIWEAVVGISTKYEAISVLKTKYNKDKDGIIYYKVGGGYTQGEGIQLGKRRLIIQRLMYPYIGDMDKHTAIVKFSTS